jgi:hypothetical protein
LITIFVINQPRSWKNTCLFRTLSVPKNGKQGKTVCSPGSQAKWIKNHPEYLLQTGFEGLGFTARRRNEQGQAVDSPVAALTLDELAALVDTRGA